MKAEDDKIRGIVLAEAKKGKIVIRSIEGLASMHIKEFIKQPIEGILYDLNRSPEVVLAFIDDPKWVNDYAVMLVITELKKQLEFKNNKEGK